MLLISLFVSTNNHAQQNIQEDSLVAQLKDRIKNNKDSIDFYLEILEKKGTKTASAESYFLKGYRAMKVGDFRKAIANYENYIAIYKDSLSEGSIDQLNRIAICHKYIGSDSSLYFYNKAIHLAEETKYTRGIANGYSGIGMVLELKGKYSEAIDLHTKAYAIYKELNDSLGISTTLNSMGNVMYYQSSFSKALEYYKKSAAIDKKRNNTMHLASSYGNIGMIYNLIDELDSALYYNLNCMRIFEQIKDNHSLGTIYNNIALVYYDLEEYRKSLSFHEKSLKIKEEIGDKNGLATSYVNIGNLQVIFEDLESAKINFEKGIEMALEIDSKVIEMDAHKGLSKVFKLTGKYDEALNEYLIYDEINDSLNNLQSKNKIAELENSFDLKNKDNQISQLENESALNEVQVKLKTAQRNFLFGAAALIFIIFLFSFFYWRQRQSINTKTIALTNEKINLLMKDNEINYTKALVEGEEKERKRIAQDLHDRLGGTLSSIKLRLSSSASDRIEKTQEMLDGAVEELRKISHNLASISLIKFGLISSLKSLCETINSEKLKIDFLHHGIDERLPVEITVPIYRAIQELFSNIIKHAKASKVTLQVQRNSQQLNVIVEDNGKGFNPKAEFEGMGLKSVKSRVEAINGKITFDSSPFSGTTVIIDIPLKS